MIYIYQNINSYSSTDYINIYKSLPKNDQIHIDKLHNQLLKHQSILSKYLLSKILKEQYQIDYSNQTIKYGKYGKPMINHINYNISHNFDYVLIATNENQIGVDIAKIRPVNLNIMKHFCNQQELEYINKSQDKYLSFWRIYTLKEAYYKMLGKNLANMKSVTFIIENNQITCKNNPHLLVISNTDIPNYIYAIISRKN